MMATWLSLGILWILTLAYGYGAAVHIANMAGLTGFDWGDAPLKWQLLDVVYLLVDVLVVVGLWRRWWPSLAAFVLAATSQIALYTVGREWIVDVPEDLAPSPDQLAYLDGLVVFHVVSLLLFAMALWIGPSMKDECS